MGALYRKVAVSERLPEKEKDYFFMKRGGFDFQLETYRITKEKFFKNGFNYWLEEIPETIKSDNTETLANALQQIEKLEADKTELLEALEKCNNELHFYSGHTNFVKENESLIQKLKH